MALDDIESEPPEWWFRIFTVGLNEAHRKNYLELSAGEYLIASRWKTGKTTLISGIKQKDIDGVLKDVEIQGKSGSYVVAQVLKALGGTKWLWELEIPDLSPYGKIGILAACVNQEVPNLFIGP